jgi:hypothetical protein
MLRNLLTCLWLALVAHVAAAADTPAVATVAKVEAKSAAKAPREPASKSAQTAADAKTLSGMSILGNQEAPKALVIVPWKSSQLGDTQGLSKVLDDARQPVDKDVFMRELSYYELRKQSK